MEEKQMENAQAESTKIEGRNAVLEAFRSGKTIDKLFVLDGCKDGPIQTILREAKKHDTLVQFVAKERLEQHCSWKRQYQGIPPASDHQPSGESTCAGNDDGNTDSDAYGRRDGNLPQRQKCQVSDHGKKCNYVRLSPCHRL